MSNVVRVNMKSRRVGAVVQSSQFDKNAEQKDLRQKEEEIFRRQIEAAYQKGFEEGQAMANQTLSAEYENKLHLKYQHLDQIFGNFDNQISEYGKSFNQVVVEMSLLISEKILQRKIEDESSIIDVLKESLKKVLGANSITVKLHPNDLNIIEKDSGNLLAKNSLSHMSFEPDERIQPGGCLVLSEIGNVDGRISSQLNEIEQKLKKSIEIVEED